MPGALPQIFERVHDLGLCSSLHGWRCKARHGYVPLLNSCLAYLIRCFRRAESALHGSDSCWPGKAIPFRSKCTWTDVPNASSTKVMLNRLVVSHRLTAPPAWSSSFAFYNERSPGACTCLVFARSANLSQRWYVSSARRGVRQVCATVI